MQRGVSATRIVLIVGIILILVFILYLIVIRPRRQGQTNQPRTAQNVNVNRNEHVPTPAAPSDSAAEAPPVNVADWQPDNPSAWPVYRNNRERLSLRYPPGWTAIEPDPENPNSHLPLVTFRSPGSPRHEPLQISGQVTLSLFPSSPVERPLQVSGPVGASARQVNVPELPGAHMFILQPAEDDRSAVRREIAVPFNQRTVSLALRHGPESGDAFANIVMHMARSMSPPIPEQAAGPDGRYRLQAVGDDTRLLRIEDGVTSLVLASTRNAAGLGPDMALVELMFPARGRWLYLTERRVPRDRYRGPVWAFDTRTQRLERRPDWPVIGWGGVAASPDRTLAVAAPFREEMGGGEIRQIWVLDCIHDHARLGHEIRPGATLNAGWDAHTSRMEIRWQTAILVQYAVYNQFSGDRQRNIRKTKVGTGQLDI